MARRSRFRDNLSRMSTSLTEFCRTEIAALKDARTWKKERVLEGPTGARVRVDGRDVLMLTSNNYLGFANHPRIVEAATKALQEWGNGLGSVRFICGTQALHKELEATISKFFGTEDTILYMSCWNANEGLFAPLLAEEDGLLTDALNHASIIDGVRLCKAKRFVTPHGDLPALEKALQEAASLRRRLFITDGVFSMEGEIGPLPALADLCEKYDTAFVVDDSHATGVLGKTGRGSAEELGVMKRVSLFTSTLGKAMGSAAGGFTTGPSPVVDLLRQRSRTSLFSNALPPAVAAASLEAFRMLMEDPSPAHRVHSCSCSCAGTSSGSGTCSPALALPRTPAPPLHSDASRHPIPSMTPSQTRAPGHETRIPVPPPRPGRSVHVHVDCGMRR